MNAKQLAESMLDGTLYYDPKDDALYMASEYLEAHKLLTLIRKNLIILPNRNDFIIDQIDALLGDEWPV